ncbi:MAG: cysteine desulfurase family protein [Candidatus Asgardarchaeia archaeon]
MSDLTKSIKELLEFHGEPEREVYLDTENSGWVAPEVLEEMLPYFNKRAYGNPAITHKVGWESYETLREAALKISRLIGADSPQNIAFTHSGTEANNLAIIGYLMGKKGKGLGKKIIVSSIEHLSVIHTAEYMQKYGFKVIKLPVDGEGKIDLDKLSDLVDKDTSLVSIMMVNHEIGTIEPIKDAVEIVKDKNPDAVFHTDAVEAFGRMRIDVKKLGLDMMTLSSHKILGPKGVGALYIRDGLKVDRIIYGQLSVEPLWPGVENLPAIVGFSKASELCYENFDEKINHMRKLRDKLIDGIIENIPYTILNGPYGKDRVVDNVNVSFLYCEGEAITIELSTYGVYVSSGSACTSRILQPSHVMLAIGRKYEEAHGSILMKVNRYHTEDDVDYVLEVLPKAIERIRMISSSKPNQGDV